ncbi:MAG: hypothetical protein JO222_01885, partial [Frankiales bacterium]|nr:hypothetical protein [Frankiales bacterium]
MTTWAWLVPALPAVAAALGWFVPRRTDVPAAATAIVGSLASLVVAIAVLASAEANPATVHESSTAWTPTGGIALHIGTRIDGLAAVVAVMVAVVSLLVQVYSVVYMSGDRRYAVYAAEVSLFSAAMLLVVVSSDLFELLVGWEVMGLCSYLLIGHYWQTEGARAAAVKAFVTTRLGDTGFLFGIFALGVAARSFDISDVLAKVPAPMVRRYADYLSPTLLSSSNLSHTTLVVGALLLIAGVVGKSAQFPLHVWLPDAMAGPTPISALIHAATMVAAGIYVVARLYPIFLAAHAALVVLGIIACIT